jgi:hypothetical protein
VACVTLLTEKQLMSVQIDELAKEVLEPYLLGTDINGGFSIVYGFKYIRPEWVTFVSGAYGHVPKIKMPKISNPSNFDV